jgi:hypothetical protein
VTATTIGPAPIASRSRSGGDDEGGHREGAEEASGDRAEADDRLLVDAGLAADDERVGVVVGGGGLEAAAGLAALEHVNVVDDARADGRLDDVGGLVAEALG